MVHKMCFLFKSIKEAQYYLFFFVYATFIPLPIERHVCKIRRLIDKMPQRHLTNKLIIIKINIWIEMINCPIRGYVWRRNGIKIVSHTKERGSHLSLNLVAVRVFLKRSNHFLSVMKKRL